jgi:hypothetical protein
MSNVRITYTRRVDVSPEAELAGLTSVYNLILRKHQERQRATRPGGPEDRRKDKDAPTYPNCT